MLSEIKPRINPIINFVAKPFVKVHPTILSLFGIVPPILFVVFLVNEQYIWALVTFLGLFLDTLDGAVARMTGKVTEFGGLLDSTLDRLTDAIFIFGFALVGIVSYPLAAILLVLSYLISYIRSRAELAGKARFVLNIGLIERPERLLVLFVSLLGQILFPSFTLLELNFASWGFILLSILSFYTVMQRIIKSKSLLDK